MMVIISPAKTLDFSTKPTFETHTIPYCQDKADNIAALLNTYSIKELAHILKVSQKLAETNAERYANWTNAPLKQAIYAYNGDVYEGLQAYSWNEQELLYAQSNLRIISGVYGLLRPLDLIKPYRLDMGSPLNIDNTPLYNYWRNTITNLLLEEIKNTNSKYLINLASQEYYSAIDTKKLHVKIITPAFLDNNKGKYMMISFFAKRARGLMTRYIIDNQINDPELLIGFNSEGYMYNHSLSKDEKIVFTRG